MAARLDKTARRLCHYHCRLERTRFWIYRCVEPGPVADRGLSWRGPLQESGSKTWLDPGRCFRGINSTAARSVQDLCSLHLLRPAGTVFIRTDGNHARACRGIAYPAPGDLPEVLGLERWTVA